MSEYASCIAACAMRPPFVSVMSIVLLLFIRHVRRNFSACQGWSVPCSRKCTGLGSAPRITASLEGAAIPLAEVRGGVIRRLQEIEQGVVGRVRLPHGVVRQQEFSKLAAVERRTGSHFGRGEASWLRIGIRIERR